MVVTRWGQKHTEKCVQVIKTIRMSTRWRQSNRLSKMILWLGLLKRLLAKVQQDLAVVRSRKGLLGSVLRNHPN